ncbi:hypothetical protein SpCBS45565_g03842 [Spizellomyces sp. 'palustris']|nr:hypothetical protein SpCBS45565_g03842 [Spizellomyces sp. 'palustris']
MTSTTAHPQWKPAGKTDARSPCPLLNALANHDILPHSGRDIDPTTLTSSLRKAGIDPGISDRLVSITMGMTGRETPSGKVLDLDMLNEHNLIEHDASLTRSDSGVGDNSAVNKTLVEQLLAFSKDGKTIDYDDMAKLRRLRYRQSQATNKNLIYGAWQYLLASGEAVLLIETFGGKEQKIPIETARELLLHERFPENWTPKETPTGRLGLFANVAKLRFKMLTAPSHELEKQALRDEL